MTQFSVFSNIGWGELLKDLDEAKTLLGKSRETSKRLMIEKANLSLSIRNLNDARRRKVVESLRQEGRAICILHSSIFIASGVEEWLVPAEEVVVLDMVKSWYEKHREYDGDPNYTRESLKYQTTACRNCASLVHPPANFTDLSGKTHHRDYNSVERTGGHEKLYTDEILDIVSERYYQMAPVTEAVLDAL